MLNDFLINIFASIVFTLLGYLIAIAVKYLKSVRPNRILWNLSRPEKLVICSAAIEVDTGSYLRPTTGIGQVRAITFLITSLNKAYKEIDARRIILSTEQIKQKIEHDIIVLGGPKNNTITKTFLEKIKHLNLIDLPANGDIHWMTDKKIFKAEIRDNTVVKDFGVMIRMDNPFSSDKANRFVLFAGSHTFGTTAAAKYFCENLQKNKDLRKIKNLVAIVSCDIFDGYPVGINLVDYKKIS